MLSLKGDFEESEEVTLTALRLVESLKGPDHYDCAECVSLLAVIYKKQDKFEQAEAMFEV